MCVNNVRRAAIAATLFAVTACSGGSSLSPGVQGGATQSQSSHETLQQFQRAYAFVHGGMPFMPALPVRNARLPGFSPNYSTKGILLFEGDQALNAVQIYAQKSLGSNPAPFATITDGLECPYGLTLNAKETLYVANNCGANVITEYPKGSTTESASITSGISNPLGIVVDSKGTLYVANYPGEIQEYAAGSTSPTTTITSPDFVDPFGLALDKNENLYVADFGTDNVYEVPFGTSTVTSLGLQDISEPLNLGFDKSGNLWVTDGAGDKVNVYAPGATTPKEEITTGYSFPYQLSIDAKGAVYVSNLASQPNVYGYKPGKYKSYVSLTNGISLPTGLLASKQ
jgi:serine/threonine-protein kinase